MPWFFLGGGRITGALLAELRLAGYSRPIVVHDRHTSELRQLRVQYGVKVEPDLHRRGPNRRICWWSPCGRIQSGELLRQIGQFQSKARPTIAVSLAAGHPN